LNDVVANRAFDSLDGLDDVFVDRCKELDEQPDVINHLANHHWWSMKKVVYRSLLSGNGIRPDVRWWKK
jgi:hypothetical protein